MNELVVRAYEVVVGDVIPWIDGEWRRVREIRRRDASDCHIWLYAAGAPSGIHVSTAQLVRVRRPKPTITITVALTPDECDAWIAWTDDVGSMAAPTTKVAVRARDAIVAARAAKEDS